MSEGVGAMNPAICVDPIADFEWKRLNAGATASMKCLLSNMPNNRWKE